MIDSIYKSPSFGSDDSINDRVFLQNLPSILCAKFLEPKPQQLILDMCSAPGGKTMHLANLTKDKVNKIINIYNNKKKKKKIVLTIRSRIIIVIEKNNKYIFIYVFILLFLCIFYNFLYILSIFI